MWGAVVWWWLRCGGMSLEAFVSDAGRALGQGQSLYGPAPVGVGFASAPALDDARGQVDSAVADSKGRWSGPSGEGYRDQARGSTQALDATTSADRGTGAGVSDGGAQARQGRAGAEGVVDDARRGVAAIAPATGTQAGKVEMVNHLQERLMQMRGKLLQSEQRNIALAQAIRGAAAGYPRGNPAGGGMPMGGGGGGFSPAGFGGGGGSPGSGFTLPRFTNLLGGAGRPGRQGPDMPGTPQARVGSGGGPAAQQAVRAAMTKLGRPYVWGAKGPDSFDCSGLVQWAYAQAGVTLGPDTYTQFAQGRPVAPGDVTTGDWVFPTSSMGSGGKSGPGHVMLAISPTEVIEAQQTGVPIKISPMPASFSARRLA